MSADERYTRLTFSDAAIHLWKCAPFWRLTVAPAVVFAVIAMAEFGSLIFGHPRSDARLEAYLARQSEAGALPPGARCEEIALAFESLTGEDRIRSRTDPSRAKAVAEGLDCRDRLVASDQRFTGLKNAVAAARDHPQDARAAAALQALDAFDRSRNRFVEEGSLVKEAQSDVDALTDSDLRADALARAASAFRHKPTPQNAVAVVDAAGKITSLDRARATPARQADLSLADGLVQRLEMSRANLPCLAEALGPDAERQLKAAAAAVFPEELIEHAASSASGITWTMLQDGIAAMQKTGAPCAFQLVDALYRFLKAAPAAELNPGERGLLAEGKAAADVIAASDRRLTDLLDAASAWQRRGVESANLVMNTVQALTAFDRDRFADQHRQAWNALHVAATILRGPQLGLNLATKREMGIWVHPAPPRTSAGEDGRAMGREHQIIGGLARDIQEELRRVGFRIVDNRAEAALVAAIGWAGPAMVWVDVAWTVDGTRLFSDEFAADAKADPAQLVHDVVERFLSVTDGHIAAQ